MADQDELELEQIRRYYQTEPVKTWGGGGSAVPEGPEAERALVADQARQYYEGEMPPAPGEITVPPVVETSAAPGREITIPPVEITAGREAPPGQQVAETVIGADEASMGDDPTEAPAGPMVASAPQVSRAGAIDAGPTYTVPEEPETDDASLRISVPEQPPTPRTSMEAARQKFDAMEQERALVARVGNKEADRTSQMAAEADAMARKKIAASEAADAAARQAEAEQREQLGKLQQDLEGIRQRKVDIRPLLSNAGFQFTAILAGIAGGFAQGMGATKTNLGLDAINGVIERELDMQVRNLEKDRSVVFAGQNLINQQMAIFGRAEAARAAAKVTMFEGLEQQMLAHYERAGIPIQQARRMIEMVGISKGKAEAEQALLAQLEERKRKLAMSAYGARMAAEERMLKRMKMAADIAKIRAETGEIEAKTSQLGEGGVHGFVGGSTLDEDQAREMGIKAPAGGTVVRGFVFGPGVGKEDAKEARSAVADLQAIGTLTQDIKRARARMKTSGLAADRAIEGTTGMTSPDLAKIETSLHEIIAKALKLGHYGVPQPSELKRLEGIIGTGRSLSESDMNKLDGYVRSVEKTVHAQLATLAPQEAVQVYAPGGKPTVTRTGRPFALPELQLVPTSEEKAEGVGTPRRKPVNEKQLTGT